MIPLTSRHAPPTALVELRDQLLKLLDAAEAALPMNQEAARASLVQAMNLLTQPSPEAGPKPCLHGGLVSWQVKRVMAFVEQHLGSTIRVTDMACQTRLSLSHFSHAFTHTFGEPPLEFARQPDEELLLSLSAVLLLVFNPLLRLGGVDEVQGIA